MSSGDITAIRILGSVKLPGGGFTTTGVAVQHKTMVWGEITCTYVSTGIDLATASAYHGGGVRALGLETLDFIDFHQDYNDNEIIDKDNLTLINLDIADNLIYMIESVGGNSAAAPTDADAMRLTYWAIGDAPSVDVT